MSMHLEGPWLSTTGKKKGKKKFASAAHAAKARELDESWAALMTKYTPASGPAPTSKRQTLTDYKLPIPPDRDHRKYKSLNTGGVATLAPAKVYTGTMVKGIATMHKSNAVPVFSDEEAVDISRMRR